MKELEICITSLQWLEEARDSAPLVSSQEEQDMTAEGEKGI